MLGKQLNHAGANWKGGICRTIGIDGYVRIHKNINGKKHLYQEHRIIMENNIGRKLKKYENVHHINGIRSDNRIENLEIWNRGQPSGQRVKDQINHAIEILKLYAPEKLKDKTCTA